MPPIITLTRLQARRFHRRAATLDRPLPDVGAALEYHGYVQIDPINVCGRMHDLILRNRVAGYREGDLMRHLHGEDAFLAPERRLAFEHHLPSTSILVAFPRSAWPHLLARMRARGRRAGAWSGRLTPRERGLAGEILAELARRGPLSSDDIDDDRRSARQGWGKATLAKATLQKLFFHGRVLISGRKNHRRIYHLPERVLGEDIVDAREPKEAETARWLVLQKLRQHRLVALRRADLPLVSDQVQPLAVEGCSALYCLRDDLPLLESAQAGNDRGRDGATETSTLLLAPLDPLIYDRRVTLALWDFEYTWEVYTPSSKRVRGYYALPLLSGTELVGHADLKANRAEKRLAVVNRFVRRGYSSAEAVGSLANFLGLGKESRRRVARSRDA